MTQDNIPFVQFLRETEQQFQPMSVMDRLEAEYEQIYNQFVALRGQPRDHLRVELRRRRKELGIRYREQARLERELSRL
jgi:hypothetical protein